MKWTSEAKKENDDEFMYGISVRDHDYGCVCPLCMNFQLLSCSFVSMKMMSLPNMDILCYSIFSFYSRIVKGSIDKQVCSLGPDYIVSIIIIIGPILQMKKKKMRLSKALLQG